MEGRRKLATCLVAALTAGTGALLGAPLHAAAASFTLTASTTSATGASPVTLTATVSPAPLPSYTIQVYEVSSGTGVAFCTDTDPCAGTANYPGGVTATFQAQMIDNLGNYTWSNTVTVSWAGGPGYSLTLAASATQAPGGQPVTLTATASPNLPTGYYIFFSDAGTNDDLAGCYYTNPCSGQVTYASGAHSFVATLEDGSGAPPIATSNQVTVTWVNASQILCQPPTIPTQGGTVAGLDALLTVKASTSQVIVCFRVDGGPGSPIAEGGAVVVDTAVPALPHLVSGNLCSNATGNVAPGPHPLVSVTLGVPIFLDTYQGVDAGTDTWVCTSVNDVGETVVIPSLSASPTVTFIRDPDSLV